MSEQSLLEFPCAIPIKVFGTNDGAFRSAVLDTVGKHFDSVDPAAVSERTSRADKYLSLTITVYALNREQIDACYRDLSAHDRIMMVL